MSFRCGLENIVTKYLKGANLNRAWTFKYLCSTYSATGNFKAEVRERVKTGWKKWKEVVGIASKKASDSFEASVTLQTGHLVAGWITRQK